MRQKNTLSMLASALLLFAVTFGTASCSQSDDTLPAGAAVARGGEPLNIRIAPKPGYTESVNTRATVNEDTGAFAWEAGDHIIVFVTFNDAAATTVKHWGTYHSGSTASYIADWDMVELRDDLTGSPAVSKLVWPLGASSATVIAVHSANLSNVLDAEGYSISNDYMRDDYMRFSKTVALGESLTIDFAHLTTRLVFTGMAGDIMYTLKVNGVAATFPNHINHDDLTPCDYIEKAFYVNIGGGTVHAELDTKLDANGKVKLELVTDGATVYTTTLTAQGAAGAYKMDGYIYKVKVADGGKVNPGNSPDLVTAPIVPGNMIWELNGYYITAPDAQQQSYYQWSTNPSATAMDNDPCAGHGNWRMPSMKDFEKMAGWTETWPWSQGVNGDYKEVLSNQDIWYAAMPKSGNLCWSTDVCAADASQVWGIYCNGPYYGGRGSSYDYDYKDSGHAEIRCVQLK